MRRTSDSHGTAARSTNFLGAAGCALGAAGCAVVTAGRTRTGVPGQEGEANSRPLGPQRLVRSRLSLVLA